MTRAGAFFDLDGTVVQPPSLEWQLARRLLARGELRAKSCVAWLGRICAAASKWDPGSSLGTGAFAANKSWLADVREENLAEAATQVALQAALYPEIVNAISEHAAQGRTIFFVSGTLQALAQALAQRFSAGAFFASATQVEIAGGFCSGRIASEAMCGPEKAVAVMRLATQHNIDLAESFAYANSYDDRLFLGAVAHPVAVRPDRRLAALARDRKWPVLWPQHAGNADAAGSATQRMRILKRERT